LVYKSKHKIHYWYEVSSLWVSRLYKVGMAWTLP
jgi:hypothetical protein